MTRDEGRGGWRPIKGNRSDLPADKQHFVAIGITDGNDTTGGRAYVTDPYCVWIEHGSVQRWPHRWGPTHFALLPPAPETAEASA